MYIVSYYTRPTGSYIPKFEFRIQAQDFTSIKRRELMDLGDQNKARHVHAMFSWQTPKQCLKIQYCLFDNYRNMKYNYSQNLNRSCVS